MTNPNESDSSESEPVLNSQTICAFVDELFRLAEDTKIHVSESIGTPRLLSNMAAIKPIVSLLSNQGYSNILKQNSIKDSEEDDDKPNPIGFSPSGNQ
jgi:hypothetical protein